MRRRSSRLSRATASAAIARSALANTSIGFCVSPSRTTRERAPPPAFISRIPRECDATSAPSLVAIGTYTSRGPAEVSTSIGPAIPSGTWAKPTRFSTLPRAAPIGTGSPARCGSGRPAADSHTDRRRATGSGAKSSSAERGIGGSGATGRGW